LLKFVLQSWSFAQAVFKSVFWKNFVLCALYRTPLLYIFSMPDLPNGVTIQAAQDLLVHVKKMKSMYQE